MYFSPLDIAQNENIKNKLNLTNIIPSENIAL